MGLPKTIINFAKELGSTAVKRGERGTLLILCKEADASKQGVFKLTEKDQIPSGLSQGNKDYIARGFLGGVVAPREVIVVSADTVQNGLNLAETQKFNYCVAPVDATAPEIALVETWVKDLRDLKNIKVRAVLPKQASNHEGIINFTTDNIKVGAGTFTAAEYCSRIASLIVGTPLTESATYKVLNEVTDVPKFTKAQLDTKIDGGEFVVFHDGVKVKVGRGVSSLVNITGDKTEDMKYIKIVDTMDLIYTDIKTFIEDEYIGKYANNYDNKLKLIVAIQAYLDILEKNGLINKGWSIGIDLDSQKKYLVSKGKDISKMENQEIKEANTGTNVFLTAKVSYLNSIEDTQLNIFA